MASNTLLMDAVGDIHWYVNGSGVIAIVQS